MSKLPPRIGCRSGRYRLTRRDFVRVGSLSAFGVGLAGWSQAATATPTARARHCILIWLDGGPSHLDTFDIKPSAPQEVRGPFQPIATALPGIQFSELLPEMARRLDRMAIIRSLTSPLGEHNFGTHYLMTGYKPTPVLEYPSVGSVVAELADTANILPGHIGVPRFRVGGSNFSGNGFLSAASRPFSLDADPAKPDFRVRDLDYYPGLSRGRLDRRREFLAQLDQFGRALDSEPGEDDPLDQAYRLVTSEQAKQAFDLGAEPQQVRQRYGPRTVGQSCLLARRLVERGVPFVTVNHSGWDTHENAYTRLKEGYTGARVPVGLVPSLDQAVGALIDDLHDRGLLDETLLVVMGEFGRTPKLNTAGGRDHWPRVFSVALAGGGIEGGQIVGSSDAIGESPHDAPITPADLTATLYALLGLDPKFQLHTPDGRPIYLSEGQPISALTG